MVDWQKLFDNVALRVVSGVSSMVAFLFLSFFLASIIMIIVWDFHVLNVEVWIRVSVIIGCIVGLAIGIFINFDDFLNGVPK